MVTLKKKATVAHGYDLVNGEVVPVSPMISGHYTSARHLLPKVRKERPNFILDSATLVTLQYTMPDDDFMAVAECETIEQAQL